MTSKFDVSDQINWLKSIDAENMNTQSIITASKLAREIKNETGVIVNLSEDDVLVNLGLAVFEINKKDVNHTFATLIELLNKNKDNETSSQKIG